MSYFNFCCSISQDFLTQMNIFFLSFFSGNYKFLFKLGNLIKLSSSSLLQLADMRSTIILVQFLVTCGFQLKVPPFKHFPNQSVTFQICNNSAWFHIFWVSVTINLYAFVFCKSMLLDKAIDMYLLDFLVLTEHLKNSVWKERMQCWACITLFNCFSNI